MRGKTLTKSNANFSILGFKNAEKWLKIFLYLYKYMVYNNSSNNISTYCLIFNVGQKHWFLACSFKMLDLFKGWNFQDVLKLLQKSKNIACSISQSVTNWCNKKVALYFCHGTETYPLSWILNGRKKSNWVFCFIFVLNYAGEKV